MAATDARSKREFATEVVSRLATAGYQALWAGGCVRDLLLGRLPEDYDVATSARPDEVRAVFGHNRTLAIGVSFGVIAVRGPRSAGNVEVATFRTDGDYGDGRRPDEVSFSTAEHDAQRRDFTINGMFYDPIAQQTLDFVGGQQDLDNGIVRAIGVATDRMREDKLRMLRAVRFAATLDFDLDADTATAVRAMATEIEVVSAERISQELLKVLVHQHRARGIRLAYELGLLPVLFPELYDCEERIADWNSTIRTLDELVQPSRVLAFAAFLQSLAATMISPNQATRKSRREQDPVLQICRRMRLSNEETAAIDWLLRNAETLGHASTLTIAQLKRLLVHDQIPDLFALVDALNAAKQLPHDGVEYAANYLAQVSPEELNPPLLLSGDDLIRAGYRAGPQFKPALEVVRDAQLEGEITTHAEALELAARILSPPSSGDA